MVPFQSFTEPVDCKFGPWSVGACSTTCGSSASRTKTREILVESTNGGKQCDGAIEILEKCDLEPCPSKDLVSFYITVISRKWYGLVMVRYR